MAVKIRSTHRNKQFLIDAIGALERLDKPAFSSLLAKTGDSQAYKIKAGLPDGMLDLLSEIDHSTRNSDVLNSDSAMIIIQCLVEQPVISDHVKVMAMMLLGGILDKPTFDQAFGEEGLLASKGPLPPEKGYEMAAAVASAFSKHVNDNEDLDILMVKFNRAKEHSRQWAFQGVFGFKFSNEAYMSFMKRLAPEDQNTFFHHANKDIFVSPFRREMMDMGYLPRHAQLLTRVMSDSFETDDTHCFDVLLKSIDSADFLGYFNEHRVFNDLRQPDVDNKRSEKQKEMSAKLNETFRVGMLNQVKTYGERPLHQQAFFVKSVVRECIENNNAELFNALVATIDQDKLLGLAPSMIDSFQELTQYLHHRAARDEEIVLTTSRAKMLEVLKGFADQSIQVLFQASLSTPDQQIKKAERHSRRENCIGPDVFD